MSLRNQISIRILFISLGILFLGCCLSIWQAQNAVKKEVDSSINLALQLIKMGGSNTELPETAWITRLNNLDQTRHLSIYLKDSSDQTIHLSKKPFTNEQTSSPPDWFIQMVIRHYPKVEYKIHASNNKEMSLIIQANPLDEIAEVWDETISFFSTLLLFVSLTFLSIQLVFNKTLQAIQSIVTHLREIETGNYQNKLPHFSTQEYNDIASAINHMTYVLDNTQQQNKALTQHSLKIQEDERQRLSQELHDELGQSLTAIKVMAVASARDSSSIKKISSSIVAICDHLMVVVRSMMKQLHPLILKELGLKATIEDIIYHWQKRTSSTTFNFSCDEAVDQIDQATAIQIYRVVQEGLTNIIRHAHANQITVCLDVKTIPGKLNLIITDNGQGFDKNQISTGFGLLGMEERIHLLGGSFMLHSQQQIGTKIEIQIPL